MIEPVSQQWYPAPCINRNCHENHCHFNNLFFHPGVYIKICGWDQISFPLKMVQRPGALDLRMLQIAENLIPKCEHYATESFPQIVQWLKERNDEKVRENLPLVLDDAIRLEEISKGI